MLKHFEEFGEYVEITGFSSVQIEDAEGFLKATRREQQETAVQFFNAELVATWQHLYFAVLNALTAFRNKSNISKQRCGGSYALRFCSTADSKGYSARRRQT